MAFCSNCGAKLADGANFCASCGAKVVGVEGKRGASPVASNKKIASDEYSLYFATKENDDGTLTLTGFSEYFPDTFFEEHDKLVIPSVIDGKKVTAIADDFGAEVFEDLKKAVDAVEIQEGIKTLGNNFLHCLIINKILQLPTTLETIGDVALYGKVQVLTIPENVSKIGIWKNDLSSLSRILVESSNPNFCAIDGVLFTKDKKTLIRYPNCKKGKNFIVPEGVKIQEYAFARNRDLLNVTFPNSIEIPHMAFLDAPFYYLVIPDNAIVKEEAFFRGNITSVEIGSNVKIEAGAFKFCNLDSVKFKRKAGAVTTLSKTALGDFLTVAK